MNLLIVGGAGYIGSHCVRQAVAAGHRVVFGRELGWVPRHDTLDGIVRTACDWHPAHPQGYAS